VLLCRSDTLALLCCQVLERAGRRVGMEVAVAGSSDSSLAADWDPPLTTVAVPDEALADHALQRLLARIAGRCGEPVAEQLPARLLERASTQAFAVQPV